MSTTTSTTSAAAAAREEAATLRAASIDWLRKALLPGSVVTTYTTAVNREGTARTVLLLVAHEGRVVNVSGAASRVLGVRRDREREGLRMTGGGMDMGYQAVYSLSRVLYPDAAHGDGLMHAAL